MKQFFKELRLRWSYRMSKFWHRVWNASLWLSGLQVVIIPVLEHPTIVSFVYPQLIDFLKFLLTASVTAGLVAKLTVEDSKKLYRKLHEEDKNEVNANNRTSNGAALSLLLLLFALPSCVSFQRCQEKFGTKINDTLTVEVPIRIPKDSAVLRYEVRRIPLNIPIFNKSENGAKITLTKTEENGQEVIEAQADCPEIEKIVPVKVPYEKIVFQCPDKRWWKVWQNWALIWQSIFLLFFIERSVRAKPKKES